MEVEDLKLQVTGIRKIVGIGATKAIVDISIADAFVVKGCRVMEGEKGLFVGMPREEGKDGKWYNSVIVLRRDVKDAIELMVLEAYDEMGA